MSIISASRLSRSELALLGNNIRPSKCQKPESCDRRRQTLIAAVNRSISRMGESISRLHRSNYSHQ
jgi:hypothetical protein